jgi:hypothetical protein
MVRSRRSLFIAALCLAAGILGAGLPRAQQLGRVSSDHVIVQMPAERELLGRQLIGDLERCYAYMNRSIGGALPRRVAVTLDWPRAETGCNRRAGHISVGMGRPEASGDREFLFHAIAREMARLGLLNLSEGAAREDTEFLFEGMIEILVHEFDHSSRSLESAWAISKLLLAWTGSGPGSAPGPNSPAGCAITGAPRRGSPFSRPSATCRGASARSNFSRRSKSAAC